MQTTVSELRVTQGDKFPQETMGPGQWAVPKWSLASCHFDPAFMVVCVHVDSLLGATDAEAHRFRDELIPELRRGAGGGAAASPARRGRSSGASLGTTALAPLYKYVRGVRAGTMTAQYADALRDEARRISYDVEGLSNGTAEGASGYANAQGSWRLLTQTSPGMAAMTTTCAQTQDSCTEGDGCGHSRGGVLGADGARQPLVVTTAAEVRQAPMRGVGRRGWAAPAPARAWRGVCECVGAPRRHVSKCVRVRPGRARAVRE
jgi:hypothetical protein